MKILKKLMKPFHRKIKTPEEYEASMKLFSALMDKGEKLSADEADYMDLLGTLLEDYERTAHPETESFLNGDIMEVSSALRYHKVAML